MPGKKILIVDDETEISALISLYLSKEGFSVVTATNSYEANKLVDEQSPDLIILDILLPDIDGFELCQQLRSKTSVPILFLSCKNDEVDKILGLTIGGDDYISKPFSPGELVARVKAHLRRNRKLNSKRNQENSVIRFPGLSIDLTGHTVYVDDKPVSLSSKEFQLLVLLASKPNTVMSHSLIYDTIWGFDSVGDTRTVMVHISNIRKKIEKNPANPQFITTLKGAGYKFNALSDKEREK